MNLGINLFIILNFILNHFFPYYFPYLSLENISQFNMIQFNIFRSIIENLSLTNKIIDCRLF